MVDSALIRIPVTISLKYYARNVVYIHIFLYWEHNRGKKILTDFSFKYPHKVNFSISCSEVTVFLTNLENNVS